jgi:phospholipid/cholesterol/gamma-HCH transport system substrate-binding protein
MLTRLTRGQILAFVVLTLVAVAYASIVYVKLPREFGIGRYQVAVDLANTSDLYEGAAVTLRGEEIGEVDDLSLTDTAVRATLSINNDAAIPADSMAQVRSISALGEQYLNFVPRSVNGPALRPGAVVPAAEVQLPVPETRLLDKANALVASLPAKDLNTTIDELGTGLSDTGADIQRLIDGAGALTAAADANLRSTRALIADAGPVLDTQRRLGPQILSITGDLAGFTDQLRRSDADLRGTIDKVPPFAGEIDKLFNDIRPDLPSVLDSLNKVAEVTRVYIPNIRHTLIVLPTTVHDLQSAIYGSPIAGAAKLSFKAIQTDPYNLLVAPTCTKGFFNEPRSVNDFSPRPPQYEASCKEPGNSPISTRGARNDPCPNDSDRRSNTAAGCGLHFQSNEDFLDSRNKATKTMLDAASKFPTSGSPPDGVPADDTVAPPFALPPAPVANRTAPSPVLAPGLSGPLNSGPLSSGPPRSAPALSSGPPAAASRVSGYDPKTGVFLAPDGQPYILGSRTANAAKPGTPAAADWRTLLTDPMGVPER